MEWNEKDQILKSKRGKRLPLRVSPTASYATLRKQAEEKWKTFHSNLYDESQAYHLLLEDGQKALFLPGSKKEPFTLSRYQEELGKDFKRITLFLCSDHDFQISEGNFDEHDSTDIGDDDSDAPPSTKRQKCQIDLTCNSDHKTSTQCDQFSHDQQLEMTQKLVCEDPLDQEHKHESDQSKHDLDLEHVQQLQHGDNLPGSRKSVLDVDVQDQEHGHGIAGGLQSQELQIQDDFEIAQAIQASLDNGMQGSNEEEIPVKGAVDNLIFSDYTSVVQSLEKHIITSEQFFLVVRRGIPFQRAISLWQRESKRKSPKNLVRVKYLGEDGIDSGALAREFFSDTITQIGNTLFPGGTPVESTLLVRNETFRTAGEIVATSLAQNGPPPNFLDEVAFDSLINLDMDIRALSPDKHLTSEEKKLFDAIREDVGKHQDFIIEHGYTGVVNEEHIDDILGSVLVSIWHKRVLCLNEFRQGMDLYGLASILSHSPDACKPLFVKGHIIDVDANYLAGALNPQYSPEGSSRRLVEEKVVDHFQDFLLSLEDDNITGYSAPIAWNYEDSQLQDRDSAELPEESSETEKFHSPELTAAGVMGWLTGQRHREMNGKKVQISVNFDHDCKIRAPNHTVCFPYVGACGMEITLPIEHMSTYEDFRHVFMLAYCKGQAFAKP